MSTDAQAWGKSLAQRMRKCYIRVLWPCIKVYKEWATEAVGRGCSRGRGQRSSLIDPHACHLCGEKGLSRVGESSNNKDNKDYGRFRASKKGGGYFGQKLTKATQPYRYTYTDEDNTHKDTFTHTANCNDDLLSCLHEHFISLWSRWDLSHTRSTHPPFWLPYSYAGFDNNWRQTPVGEGWVQAEKQSLDKDPRQTMFPKTHFSLCKTYPLFRSCKKERDDLLNKYWFTKGFTSFVDRFCKSCIISATNNVDKQ